MDMLDGSSSDEEDSTSSPMRQATAAQNKSAESETKNDKATATSSIPQASSTAGTRKARKLLSLAAVLPQKILEELTQSQVLDNGGSDDDDDDEAHTAKRRSKNKTAGSRDGITSFLSDLQSAKQFNKTPTARLSLSKKANDSRTMTTSKPLAAQLLQTTTTTVSRSGSVRDVHGEQSVETVAEDEVLNGSPTLSSPGQTRHRPLVIRPKVVSAPVLPPRVTEETMAQSDTVTNSNSLAASQNITSSNRKRSRREMESALRRGDFQQALGSVQENVVHMEQARPDSFVPEPETYAVPQHGIKVVPTTMYDPKAGAATNLASGKGRGKNQIHHLMASAANLEIQRARGMASSSNNKHRAGAKQKYGW